MRHAGCDRDPHDHRIVQGIATGGVRFPQPAAHACMEPSGTIRAKAGQSGSDDRASREAKSRTAARPYQHGDLVWPGNAPSGVLRDGRLMPGRRRARPRAIERREKRDSGQLRPATRITGRSGHAESESYGDIPPSPETYSSTATSLATWRELLEALEAPLDEPCGRTERPHLVTHPLGIAPGFVDSLLMGVVVETELQGAFSSSLGPTQPWCRTTKWAFRSR